LHGVDWIDRTHDVTYYDFMKDMEDNIYSIFPITFGHS
jgi:hypothetical protein